MKASRLFLLALVTVSLSACGTGHSVPDDGRYAVAGIDNEQDVTAFLSALQKAVRGNDRTATADLVAYPFTTYKNGKPLKKYSGRDQLLSDYESLFTPEVKKSILAATPDTLFVNYKGIMLGDGTVWFDRSTGLMKIKAINTP